jgi:hypothetical protein
MRNLDSKIYFLISQRALSPMYLFVKLMSFIDLMLTDLRQTFADNRLCQIK